MSEFADWLQLRVSGPRLVNTTAPPGNALMSPEARAKLAQNLVKARAARARNLKATAEKSVKKTATKRS